MFLSSRQTGCSNYRQQRPNLFLKHRKKYQKSNLFFTWFFPGFINIHVQMKAKFGLNLDFSWIILFSIENQWFFLLWILKNRLQPGFLENQEAALCFIYYPGLVNQFGLLNILIDKHQIWIIYLPKLVFSWTQTWIRVKTTVEFNNPFSLLSRFGKSVWITKYPDSQMPNLDNLLANYVFSQIQTWIKAKPTVEFNNPFSLLSRFG